MASDTKKFCKEIKKFLKRNIRYKDSASILTVDITNVYNETHSMKLRCSVGYVYNDYETIKETIDAIHHVIKQYCDEYGDEDVLISVRLDIQKAVNYFELSGSSADLSEEMYKEMLNSLDKFLNATRIRMW